LILFIGRDFKLFFFESKNLVKIHLRHLHLQRDF